MQKNKLNKIHRESFIIDAHCDLYHCLKYSGFNFSKNTRNRQIDFPKIKKAGIKLFFASVFVEPKYKQNEIVTETFKQIDFCNNLPKKFENLKIIKSKNDLEELEKEKIGMIIHMEGADAITNINLLHQVYKQNVRSIGFTWNFSNQLAGGAYESNKKIGLSKLGKLILNEMNKLGIIFDGSHLNSHSLKDALRLSRSPIIVSHTGAYKFVHSKRNLTINQMISIAKKDSLIGLFFSSKFIKNEDADINDLVNIIDFIVKKIGIENIGIGSDFGGITGKLIHGLESIDKLPNLTKQLILRGYSENDIKNFLGENTKTLLLKVLK